MSTKIPLQQKLITSSIQLFYTNTYSGTTIQDIAKSSNVSVGSIYNTFPTGKEGIAKIINDQYQIESSKLLATILKNNAVNSTIEIVIDEVIKALLELGKDYPCFYDQSFIASLEVRGNETESEILEYSKILFQLKFPKWSAKELTTKVRMCYMIWDSFLSQYARTNDPLILKELKTITINYLQS
jgi:AcrR family transcriptional regulator